MTRTINLISCYNNNYLDYAGPLLNQIVELGITKDCNFTLYSSCYHPEPARCVCAFIKCDEAFSSHSCYLMMFL